MYDSHAVLITTDADFTDMTFNFTVEGTDIELGVFRIKLEDITIDDDVHEIEQSFALIAEIVMMSQMGLPVSRDKLVILNALTELVPQKLELWTTMVNKFHIFMSTLI